MKFLLLPTPRELTTMAAKLDVAFYPHIFDQILASCDDTSLRALRATCRRVQSHIDSQLQRHVVHNAYGRAWGGPEAYSHRSGVFRSSWGSPDVLDILHWNEGLFPDPGERDGAKAKIKAEAIENEGKLAWWRNARLVRLFPDEDVIPYSRKAMVVRFVADPRLPSSGPAGQIRGVKSVWLSLSQPPFIGAHDEPPPPDKEVQPEPRFILNFAYHLNEFPRISVRRSAEDGPPESQFKLCVVVFTPGGEEEDDMVRANERAWEEWKREMEQEEAEARGNAQMDEQAIAVLMADEAGEAQAEETEWVTTDGETDEDSEEDDGDGDGDESGQHDEVTQGSPEPPIDEEELAAEQAELDLVYQPPPPEPEVAPTPAVPSETLHGSRNGATVPAPLPPVPPGKEHIKLTSMRAFWGLLRFFDAYTMGPCEGHGLQGDWHEMERCSRVPSLLSYIFVGTERWIFDLTNVADDVPPDEGVEFDTAAWVADVDALRAERPDTPDFQLMVEAGLARWYEPSQAEVYNDVLDHVFYETDAGFRSRYQGENYDLIMSR